MSKLVIDELFYELETTEQKTRRGGKIGKLPFLTSGKGSKPTPRKVTVPGLEPGDPGWKAELYGL